MSIERIIGIDFGTSTSVIRVKRYENGKPVGIGTRLDTQKVFDLVPTVIQEVNGHRYYGEEAVAPKGKNAIIYRNFKLDLESDDECKRNIAKGLTEAFLSFLADAYQTDSEGGHLGESTDLERTIISYPVKWCDDTKNFMVEATRKAGFPNVEGMDEAQAAIHAVVVQNEKILLAKKYLQENIPTTILLIDMGAGTTDLVLCRYTPGKQPKNEILATWPKEGDVLFGGSEVDRLLRYYVSELFVDKSQSETLLKRIPMEQFKAWKETVVAKVLENNETVDQFYTLDDLADMLEIEMKPYSLDRLAFETCASNYLKQFPKLINGCLNAADMQGEQVDLVVLTGGHSQWYFANEIIAGKMPNISSVIFPHIAQNTSRIIRVAHPQETAALGMVFSPLAVNFKNNEQNNYEKKENDIDYLKHKNEGQLSNNTNSSTERNRLCVPKQVFCYFNDIIVLKNNGKIWCEGEFKNFSCDNEAFKLNDILQKWTNIDSLCSIRYNIFVGVKPNGDVVVAGPDENLNNQIQKLKNIKQIDKNSLISYQKKRDYVIAMTNDGRIVSSNENLNGELSNWKNITSLNSLIGVCKDGTVRSCIKSFEKKYDDQYENTLKNWNNIVQTVSGVYNVAGLRSDGTVVTMRPTGSFYVDNKPWNTENWRNVIKLACGIYHVVGLCKDGTVVASGIEHSNECHVSTWKDIVSIYASDYWTAGLRKDGTVVTTLDSLCGRSMTSEWENIIEICGGERSIIGIKATGEIEQLSFELKGLIYTKIVPESVKKYTHIWQAQDKADPEVFEDYKMATEKHKKVFKGPLSDEEMGGENGIDLDW